MNAPLAQSTFPALSLSFSHPMTDDKRTTAEPASADPERDPPPPLALPVITPGGILTIYS